MITNSRIIFIYTDLKTKQKMCLIYNTFFKSTYIKSYKEAKAAGYATNNIVVKPEEILKPLEKEINWVLQHNKKIRYPETVISSAIAFEGWEEGHTIDGNIVEHLRDAIKERYMTKTESNNKNNQITEDSGIVLYDPDRNEYFCGLNAWDKQLRKAKIYHSLRYAQQASELEANKEVERKNLKLYAVKLELALAPYNL